MHFAQNAVSVTGAQRHIDGLLDYDWFYPSIEKLEGMAN